ncbi:hypothetical protein Tco_1124182 [Tanacetum coccineum]|uniref:Uncharacterized protein n=1 Tax=Tanacetum coccineum TaxID=301880 RepID=A0ABQ5J5F4_9ASTR
MSTERSKGSTLKQSNAVKPKINPKKGYKIKAAQARFPLLLNIASHSDEIIWKFMRRQEDQLISSLRMGSPFDNQGLNVLIVKRTCALIGTSMDYVILTRATKLMNAPVISSLMATNSEGKSEEDLKDLLSLTVDALKEMDSKGGKISGIWNLRIMLRLLRIGSKKNIIPSGGITCLVAKATEDEAVYGTEDWGMSTSKNINKLVLKANWLGGLPSKDISA